MKKKFNVNNYVYVKLTDIGYDRLAAYHNRYGDYNPDFEYKTGITYKGKADADGYYKIIFWEFMHVFGEVTDMGCDTAKYYELTVLLNKKDLK